MRRALVHLGIGIVTVGLLLFIFAGADWQLPGRDAGLVLIALAFGFYIVSVKLDGILKALRGRK